MYTNSNEKEDFSEAELKQKWELFLQGLNDRPHLKSTLSAMPKIEADYKLVLEIENSVQDDQVNSIRPELVSWLRKELKNSSIQVTTKITAKTNGRIIYTDGEKYEAMVKKNPQLALLRKTFGLDFDQ